MTSSEDIMTKAEMLAEVQGYDSWYNKIDNEVAREFPCDICGSICHFEGFQKGNSRRAFAVCENGHCAEF